MLEKIISDIPCPKGDENAPLKALIFDSQYDSYRGVIVYIRVFDGCVRVGDKIRMMSTGKEYEIVEVGVMLPIGYRRCDELKPGAVGYLTASIKNVRDTAIGDTQRWRTTRQMRRFGLPQGLPMVY